MSPSPVSDLSRLTVTRWWRWRLCSQPLRSGDSLEDLDSGAPTLLRGLREIAVGQFPPGLRQEMLAGLLILLGRHSLLLLLLRQISVSNLFGQWR